MIIDDVSSRYNVDSKRVFLIGHSNGAVMSHRYACDMAPRVAAIVSLGGGNWFDEGLCAPSAPVSVLVVHGTMDESVNYNGGVAPANGSSYPSAIATVGAWATRNGCTGALAPTGLLDVDSGLAGEETRVDAYSGCPTGGAVELWTIENGRHEPALQPTSAELFYGFMTAHPKP